MFFIVLFSQFISYDKHSAVMNIRFDNTYVKPKDHNYKSEKLADEEKIHNTSKDAKEILTDYPSKYMLATYHNHNAKRHHYN